MYWLKSEMAEELKDTNNRIYEDAPDELNDAKYIVTVGDICTIKINEQLRMPNLSVIDFKTKRHKTLSLEQMKMPMLPLVASLRE